jgi:hypothetical protein
MPQQHSVLERFRERFVDAAGGSAVRHPRQWRAFGPAVRFRRAANDNRAPLGLVIARVLLVAALLALGVVALI